MNSNYIDEYPFQFKYVQIRDELDITIRRYIDTLVSLITDYNQNRKNNKITNDEIKDELVRLKKAIKALSDCDDYVFFNQKYYELENMVVSNENYIDLLIRLDCTVGIKPNNFFLNRAKEIFYTDVYIPIMDGKFKEKIGANNKAHIKTMKPIKAGA